jgi:hypothetical protein
MSHCASCGASLSGNVDLCWHHDLAYGEDWAVVNRVMCDLLHRQRAPVPIHPSEPGHESRMADTEAA